MLPSVETSTQEEKIPAGTLGRKAEPASQETFSRPSKRQRLEMPIYLEYDEPVRFAPPTGPSQQHDGNDMARQPLLSLPINTPNLFDHEEEPPALFSQLERVAKDLRDTEEYSALSVRTTLLSQLQAPVPLSSAQIGDVIDCIKDEDLKHQTVAQQSKLPTEEFEVVDLTGDDDLIDLTGDDDLIDLAGAEDLIDLMDLPGDGWLIE
jgi:hypothetical protein